MIVNIRGCSGSGKSTLVNWVMDQFDQKIPLLRKGDKADFPGPKSRPYGYLLKHNHPDVDDLFVCGHYEVPCGGCDTIPSYDAIFGLVKEADDSGVNVLFEGLLVTVDQKNTKALMQEDRDLLIVALDTSIELCLSSVNERRRRKKPDAPDVGTFNIKNKHTLTARRMRQFTELGWAVISASREQAKEILYESLIDLKEEAS